MPALSAPSGATNLSVSSTAIVPFDLSTEEPASSGGKSTLLIVPKASRDVAGDNRIRAGAWGAPAFSLAGYARPPVTSLYELDFFTPDRASRTCDAK